MVQIFQCSIESPEGTVAPRCNFPARIFSQSAETVKLKENFLRTSFAEKNVNDRIKLNPRLFRQIH